MGSGDDLALPLTAPAENSPRWLRISKLYLGCMPLIWTPIEAAYHLSKAYAAEQGINADYNPITLEAIARALDAAPVYLVATWSAWREEMKRDRLPEEKIDAARYWLDVTVIGVLANP